MSNGEFRTLMVFEKDPVFSSTKIKAAIDWVATQQSKFVGLFNVSSGFCCHARFVVLQETGQGYDLGREGICWKTVWFLLSQQQGVCSHFRRSWTRHQQFVAIFIATCLLTSFRQPPSSL